MKSLLVPLCTITLLCGCSRQAGRGTVIIGGVTMGLGTSVILGGKYGDHSNVAPDGRIVAYPLGGALIGVGVIAVVAGVVAISRAPAD